MTDWQEVKVEDSDMWDRTAPIEGKLVNIKENVGPNESKIYELKTSKGLMSLWGSTVIDAKMTHVERGSMVRIEPQGEAKGEKSGRTYMDFKVFVKPAEFEEVTTSGLTDTEPITDVDLNAIFGPDEEK